MNIRSLTDAQLLALRLEQEGIQKRNPPASLAWQSASRVIHAVCAENARRYPPAGAKQ